jgi:glutamate-5-semialdehyde dehydrogenase
MSLDMQVLGQAAKQAARALRTYSSEAKNALLMTLAETLEARQDDLLAANQKDLALASAKGVPFALQDRLNLAKRLPNVIADVRKVAALHDPVGETFEARTLENGLRVHKVRVPLGVLGIIYESRPDVTVDITALALKTGNAAILRGGSETMNTNLALWEAIQSALSACGFPLASIQLITDTDRRYVGELLRLSKYVDVIIPRGGEALHTFCRENSTIPVITGGIGICHLYVDSSADLDGALEVIHNAKTQRPSACNSLDTLLVQRDIAAHFVPRVVERLASHQVRIKLDPELSALSQGDPRLSVASAGDWDVEWLDYILGVKVVAGLEEAIEHIETHGTANSDGILTRDDAAAEYFLQAVDSAVVYVNASTRFTDGSALGLGAEVAVSTQKLHARGPMALRELTTYKWVVKGDMHIRP